MKEQIIADIEQKMVGSIDNAQMKLLHQTLEYCFWQVKIEPLNQSGKEDNSNDELLELFITAKRVEGCSEKTLKYYSITIKNMLNTVNKSVHHITTDDLRTYLVEYQKLRNCSKGNIDNIRRNLSSFFSWLEDENYIIKSPIRRIHKIKTTKTVKETYTDESLELMRDSCESLRDLAIIDLLASTGMRVGELVGLNQNDIDFDNRECIVFGKGSKERPVYFDARTKIHLKNYLNSRQDDNPALFLTLNS